MKILIIGAGWLGTQLATPLLLAGHQLWLSSRTSTKSAVLPLAAEHFVLDLAQAVRPTAELEQLFSGALVICTVPASRTDGEGYLRALAQLATLMKNLGSVACIHMSSTGIYDGLSGEVNEQSVLLLDQPRIALLAQAELLLQSAVPCCTLRLAGLIGPARHPARFLSGKQAAEPEAPVNMVHSADICAAVCSIVEQQLWPELFNLSCPELCRKAEFYHKACELASLPAPVFIKEQSESSTGRRVMSTKSQMIAGFDYRFASALSALPFCS